jgi:hypothetical protein
MPADLLAGGFTPPRGSPSPPQDGVVCTGFAVRAALQFCPSISKDRAVCLWEAKSVDALKGFLAPLTAQSSRNTCYAVDNTKAMGLPIKKAAA